MNWRLRPSGVLAILCTALAGCSYVGTMMSQADYSMRLMSSPEQRIYKHMLDRETYYVFGKLLHAPPLNDEASAVLAISDDFRVGELVDINHGARPGSYYGLNLPAGDYRLLVVSDMDGNGRYEAGEVVGGRALSLTLEQVPDKVLEGFDLDLALAADIAVPSLDVPVVKTPGAQGSLFYPKGTLRSLDDPIFAPQMASLGMYDPAAFLEMAPMMFYALEEDLGYKIPVVFVHGIGGSARDFASVVARLDRTRYRPWFYHYPSGSDLKQSAAMFYKIFLSGKVVMLGELPMVVVAHSMGGLVVREAMNLLEGRPDENRVARLITIASPLGGHPGARQAARAPVVIPSWRSLNPDSEFIAGLQRRPLPPTLDYHLMFAFGDDRSIKLGNNSDGVVPLASQLSPRAQREARAQYGFDDTHTGILRKPELIEEILRIVAEVHSPFPEEQLRELIKGGYPVQLGPGYTPMEAYCINQLGYYMAAMAAGKIAPVHPLQEHFVRAARGEVPPESEIETAWLKFTRDYPDRRQLLGTTEAKPDD